MLEAVFDQLSDALILYDPEFRITGVNRAAEKLFGMSSEEILGRHCQEIFKCSVCEPNCGMLVGINQPPATPNTTVRLHTGTAWSGWWSCGPTRCWTTRERLRRGRHHQGHHRGSGPAEARSDRRIRSHARGAQLRAAGLRQRGHHHSARRGERHRQGPDRQDAALPEPAPGRAVYRHQLRGHSRDAARKRTVRLRKGSVHRARPRSAASSNWPTGAPCSWTRSARSAHAAGQTAARPGRADLPAPGRTEGHRARPARDRRHQQEPARSREGRRVPPGPLLPAQRHPDPDSAAARTRRRHLPMARFFIEHYNRKFKRNIEGVSEAAENCCCSTIGRATCANCAMRWSAP